jgi:chemotaxis protein methyltransferase CheR
MARAEIAELAALIEAVSGNVVPEGHYPFLEEIVEKRAGAAGFRDVAAYVRALARGALSDEWAALLNVVTVKESFFFRGPQQFHALTTTILPDLIAARRDQRRLLVWSAGCAHGEEPGTLAIVLSEHAGLASWDWRIVATDVDTAALAAARVGTYGDRAVASVPPELYPRYFERHSDGHRLAARARQRIDYSPLNLIQEPFPIASPRYDFIFLRNVLIYFREDSQRRVLAGLARSLAPDGALFLGPAETMWRLSSAFEPVDLGDCFCYRLRPEQAGAPAATHAQGEPRPRRTTDSHVRARTPAPPVTRCARPPSGRGASAGSSEPPPQPTAPPPPLSTAQRLRATAHALVGNDLALAGDLIAATIKADPSDPAIRFLEGFHHDIAGNTENAIASYRAALFLDPGLYQVRVLLADALRRAGWDARAHQQYRQALATLDSHGGRELAVLSELPLPDREHTRRRCRHALAVSYRAPGQPARR